MIPVKTVTQYSVASTVAKLPDAVALLSQLKQFSSCEDRRVFTTRNYWAAELGINRRTIQRWEDEVIGKLWFLSSSYYANGKRRNLLDNYQRFIICLIYSMKNGVHPFAEKMEYQQIVDYMLAPKGNPFWLGITREKFNEIEISYSRKAG